MNVRGVIFDLDGLLADCRHRLHFIEGENQDWDAFYLACGDDAVIQPSVDIYSALMDMDFHIAISTGRSEICRDHTMLWFEKNFIPNPHHVLMRGTQDYRKDYVLKEQHLKYLRSRGLEIVMAFDDRSGCVDMFHKNGIPCYHLDSEKIADTVDAAESKQGG